jgi:hypothetical protein
MKRTIGAVLAVALLIGGAGSATAGKAKFKTGNYMGTTSQERVILFKVTKKKVKHISSGFTASCGINSETSGHSGKINKKGKFTAKTVEAGGASKTVIKGKLKGRKASGTMRWTYENCDTGVIKWEAKKE